MPTASKLLRIICILLTLLSVFVYCTAGCTPKNPNEPETSDPENSPAPEDPDKEPDYEPGSYVQLIYMCGSSLETNGGAATKNIAEIVVDVNPVQKRSGDRCAKCQQQHDPRRCFDCDQRRHQHHCNPGKGQNIVAQHFVDQRFDIFICFPGNGIADQRGNQIAADIEKIAESEYFGTANQVFRRRRFFGIKHTDAHHEHVHGSTERSADHGIEQIRNSAVKRFLRRTLDRNVNKCQKKYNNRSCQIKFVLSAVI